ncbi:hypothetical protein ACRAWF_45875 [Streptomyces sp. L7]
MHEAFLKAGEPLGLMQVGALAYTTPSVESGWIPSPVPGHLRRPRTRGIPCLAAAARHRGQAPAQRQLLLGEHRGLLRLPAGYELGHGRLIHFGHGFHGRGRSRRSSRRRTRPPHQGHPGLRRGRRAPGRRRRRGPRLGPHLPTPATRVETLRRAGRYDHADRVDRPGRHRAGADADRLRARSARHRGDRGLGASTRGPVPTPKADLGFPRIRATVQVSPFDRHARTEYRRVCAPHGGSAADAVR